MIAAGAVQQAQCGTEAYRAAAAAAQLVEGGGVVARLADRLTIKQQHLIRTYDQVLRVTSCKGPGLGQRQSPGQLLGGLGGPGWFGGVGWGGPGGELEVVPEAVKGRRGGGE